MSSIGQRFQQTANNTIKEEWLSSGPRAPHYYGASKTGQ